ncbi:hypothetical protein NXC24_PC02113 (plasmid) [Rhizobium sp. NXC24]|nr:hypothetical protein NXC24_PC02113 [Rhizobium sp. NXC24]
MGPTVAISVDTLAAKGFHLALDVKIVRRTHWRDDEVVDYLPYIAGAALGLLISFILSNLLALSGTPQLILFGLLPAFCGALHENIVLRHSRKR